MYRNNYFRFFSCKEAFFSGLFSLLLLSCSTEKDTRYLYADIRAFGELNTDSEMQFEAYQAGGGGLKIGQSIVWDGVTCKWNDAEKSAFLEIIVADSSGYLEGSVKGLNLPENWKRFNEISLETTNPNHHSINLILTVFGPRSVLTDTLTVSPDQERTITVSLLDLALSAGNQPLYVPNKIRITASAEEPAFRFSVTNLRLTPGSPPFDPVCIDEFGQRIRGDWKGKITTESDLKASKTEEEVFLSEIKENTQRGDYLGLKSENKFKATGFFRLEKKSDDSGQKWWFITPDGQLFWSLGVTCIRPSNKRTAVTNIKNREFLFEELPSRTGKYGSVYASDSTISIFSLNLLKKYGSIDAWRNRALERVKKWGLNTIGNWTEDSVIFKRKLPYTYSFRTNEKPGLKMGKGVCDVFSREWMDHTDSLLAQAANFKEDPLLVGYFVDNEAGWGNLELLNIAPPESALRKKWLSILRKKYTDINALNEAWNSNYQSWKVVREMAHPQTALSRTFDTDYLSLEEAFAEQYFSFISTTLKKYDPNHLYLGCRFTRRIKPDHILAAAGKYCDVITVNVYSLVPIKEQMEQWHQKTGRPILIGEHHLPLLSQRQLPPRYRAFTQQERYKYYIEYVKTFAEMPFSLGCHWYQFSDQHLTGRLSNGENQVIGLVDITDQPHMELVEAIGVCSKNIYQWHQR